MVIEAAAAFLAPAATAEAAVMNPMHHYVGMAVVGAITQEANFAGAASAAAAASTWACLAAHPMEVDSGPTHPFSLQPASHAHDEYMELGEELPSLGSGNTIFLINFSNA